MLKGVSQKVIEVVHTDNQYFDKAILFLRPSEQDQEHAKLKLHAREYLSQITYAPHAPQKKHTQQKRLPGFIMVLIGMLAGAGITSLLFFIV